jgi:hypothetical protein
MLAAEIVRAAWRPRPCAVAEAEDGKAPATQTAVDRARASAHNPLSGACSMVGVSSSPIDRLRAKVRREGFDEAYLGIVDAHRVIKGLADNERLKCQSLMSLMVPIGIDSINQTIQSPVAPGGASPSGLPPASARRLPLQSPPPTPQRPLVPAIAG